MKRAHVDVLEAGVAVIDFIRCSAVRYRGDCVSLFKHQHAADVHPIVHPICLCIYA